MLNMGRNMHRQEGDVGLISNRGKWHVHLDSYCFFSLSSFWIALHCSSCWFLNFFHFVSMQTHSFWSPCKALMLMCIATLSCKPFPHPLPPFRRLPLRRPMLWKSPPARPGGGGCCCCCRGHSPIRYGSRSHSDGDNSRAEAPAGAVVNGDAEVEKVKPKKPKASLGDPRVEKLWVATMFRKRLWLLLGLRVSVGNQAHVAFLPVHVPPHI